MSVEALRWGEDEHIASLCARWPLGFETIVASDVLYSPRMYAALATTINALAARDSIIVLSYPERHGEEDTFIDQWLAPAFERTHRHRELEVDGSDLGAAEQSSLRVVEMRSR